MWQRSKKSIVESHQDLARVEEIRKGSVLGKKMKDRLKSKYLYQVVKKGTVAVSSLLKRKFQPGHTKIWQFLDNCRKVRQNTLFKNNQSQLNKELEGNANVKPTQAPNTGDKEVLEWYLVSDEGT